MLLKIDTERAGSKGRLKEKRKKETKERGGGEMQSKDDWLSERWKDVSGACAQAGSVGIWNILGRSFPSSPLSRWREPSFDAVKFAAVQTRVKQEAADEEY